MLAAGRQVADERANTVTAVGQHRDRLIHRQPLAPQHLAEPALRCGILAADEAEVTIVAILGHRLADDDFKVPLPVMPVPEVTTVDSDNDHAVLTILFLSDTVGGRIHDKRLAEATPYPLPAGSRLLQDLGFMAFTLPQVEILMPTRKPPGAELSPAQQRANQALHSRRLRIEHVNSSVKRCRVVKDRIRLWKQGVRDGVMEICCALHNFRLRLTPWQPMA